MSRRPPEPDPPEVSRRRPGGGPRSGTGVMVGDTDGAAVGLDDAARDRQPEAPPRRRCGVRAALPRKADVEHPRQIVLGDPAARVGDGECGPPRRRRCRRSRRWCPSLGVCLIALSEQVAQHPAELVRVDLDRQRRTASRRPAGRPSPGRPGRRWPAPPGPGRPRPTRSQVQPHRALDAGQLEQVVHHVRQPVDLDPELTVVAADGLRIGDDAVLERLGHGPHARPAACAGRG